MEEEKKEFNQAGTIKIADEVIAVLAGNATMDVAGVYNMSGSTASGIAEKFGRKNAGKGVKVETKENECIVDIHIVVEYGARIPDVAWQVQEKVKVGIEDVTGLSVRKVNIYVDGINIPKAAKPEIKIELDEEVESAE